MSERDEFEERHRSALLHDKNFAFNLWERVEALEAENERLQSIVTAQDEEIHQLMIARADLPTPSPAGT